MPPENRKPALGKALIAISGGVDSSVAALLARDAGYDCEAVMLRLYDSRAAMTPLCEEIDIPRLCDSEAVMPQLCDEAYTPPPNDSEAQSPLECARTVSELLGIPFCVLDFRDAFNEKVVENFVASYLEGSTPNPCIRCNRHIKFGALVEYAAAKGFDHIATGHYARIEQDRQTGRYLLKKGADTSKDQSYMLYTLTQQQLTRAYFPLGALCKSDVRDIAKANGFPNAGRRESQDICFIPGGDYIGFIEKRTGKATEDGPIADASGAIVGRHKGAVRYTIGQRKGLGLATPEPMYVYAKSMAGNIVYAGHEPLLYSKSLVAKDINLIPFPRLDGALRVTVKTRYRQPEQPATIEQISDGAIHVEFDSPQRAITRGQSAVFYDGNTVIGGGVIDRSPAQII